MRRALHEHPRLTIAKALALLLLILAAAATGALLADDPPRPANVSSTTNHTATQARGLERGLDQARAEINLARTRSARTAERLRTTRRQARRLQRALRETRRSLRRARRQ